MLPFFQSKDTQTSRISAEQQESIRRRSGVEQALTDELFKLLGFSPGAQGYGFEKTGSGAIEQFQDSLQVSPGESRLAGAVGQSGTDLAELLQGSLAGLTGELNTDAFVNPIFEKFNEEVLPGIRSRALQYGVPSGSKEGEVTNRAVGKFGGAVGDALSRAELERRRVSSNVLSGLVPQVHGLRTAGAQAEAGTGALERALAGKRSTAGIDILMALLQSTPRPQFAPPEIISRSQDSGLSVLSELIKGGSEAYQAYKQA